MNLKNTFDAFDRGMSRDKKSRDKKTSRQSTIFEIKIVESSEKQTVNFVYESSKELEIAQLMANFLNKNKSVAALLHTYLELSKSNNLALN
jgi:hypothetical protein